MAAAYSPNDNVMVLNYGQGFTAMALRYNATLVLFSLDIPFFVIIVLIQNIMGWLFTHDINTFIQSEFVNFMIVLGCSVTKMIPFHLRK